MCNSDESITLIEYVMRKRPISGNDVFNFLIVLLVSKRKNFEGLGGRATVKTFFFVPGQT